MLKKEFNYYVEHQNDLVAQYKGKFIVIKNQKVIGVYDNEGDAYAGSVKDNEVGTFLLHECQPGQENYTQTFRNRIIFK